MADKHWVLKNRYLILNLPKEYSEQPCLHNPEQVPEQVPEQAPEQVRNQFVTSNENIKRLVAVIGMGLYNMMKQE